MGKRTDEDEMKGETMNEEGGLKGKAVLLRAKGGEGRKMSRGAVPCAWTALELGALVDKTGRRGEGKTGSFRFPHSTAS